MSNVSGSQLPVAVRIFRVLLEGNVFWILYTMMTKGQKIRTLLQDVQYLGSRLNSRINPTWINTGVIIIVMVPLVSFLASLLPFEERDCKRMVMYYLFFLFHGPDRQNCKIWHIILPLIYIPVNKLYTAVTILIVICCYFLRNLIFIPSKTRISANKMDCINFQVHLSAYDRIIEVLNPSNKP
ncbi:hypothetical protein AVEN_125840-1 [Araneus ventricosus]|uniref:Uncharacterized protein n=1 Tax=Araneus ventricosus TaxID=182803 RepID=A0A4Y2NFC4_ARAVE|nr:hypothetical protein AVEN_125840-1 [Araneus ventricosus]